MKADTTHRALALISGLLAMTTAAAWGQAGAPDARGDAAPRFERDILPIIRAHCFKCHGDGERKGGLDLRTRAAMLKGGDSGPALVEGSVEESLLLDQVATRAMPPDKDTKLTEAQVATIRAWIVSGAPADVPDTTADSLPADRPEPTFWAFRPPSRPAVPTVEGVDRIRTPIDAFVLARLEAHGLTYSPDADRTTLIRRATSDLWGLPPSVEEVATFLADTRPDAYERLIDRLLASPRYGERWGRHWLDLAGYADSEGVLSFDYPRTAAWRYRDYVVRAFNSDKPYDRFLKEQLAGDELGDYWTAYRTHKALDPEVVEGLVATGFLRCAGDSSRPDFATMKDAPGYYYQTLDDTLKIVASSTMGLTLQCARCHTHKYDPITQEEYYRVQAIFMGAYRPSQWVPQAERRLMEASEDQEKAAKEHNAPIDAAIEASKKEVDRLRKEFGDRLFQDRLAKLPEAIREDVRVALETEAQKRSEVQAYLAGKFKEELRPQGEALGQRLAEAYPEYKAEAEDHKARIAAEEGRRRTFPEIRALYDLPVEAKTHVLLRGDYTQVGPEVTPGALPALAAPRPFAWSPPEKGARTSGRRLAFAEWLAQPGHPLTARVIVNRIWLHHFGEGIVATADNFGTTGASPTHPELLDWLAVELVARGWSLKAMHRLILNSTAYRQASAFDPAAHTDARRVDPENRLLWRQRLRRLEAEAIRDAILQVCGTLNPRMFGPPIPVQVQDGGEVTAPADASGGRRSVYLQVRRSQPLTLLQVFDQPVMETNCTGRATSTVSSQALTLMNSEFLIRQAESLATRALREDPRHPAARAFRLALARPPTDHELSRLKSFLDAQETRHARVLDAAEGAGTAPEARRLAYSRALNDLCHMLLCANEFVYVD
jgi:mono/diheme cytochrome c family protein